MFHKANIFTLEVKYPKVHENNDNTKLKGQVSQNNFAKLLMNLLIHLTNENMNKIWLQQSDTHTVSEKILIRFYDSQ